jgi:predicted phosphoribosyltransferase
MSAMHAALFTDRRDAGRELAELVRRRPPARPVVLALPNGGVPVAYEVARALHAPLDVFLVRKLGAPGQEDLAMGAIASGGARVLNEGVVAVSGASDAEIARIVAEQERDLERRADAYRERRPPARIEAHDVVVVDDGLTTGATMRAAVAALRQLRARTVSVAAPVAAQSVCSSMQELADHVWCVRTPVDLISVGLWYSAFDQPTDDDVRTLLRLAHAHHARDALAHPEARR